LRFLIKLSVLFLFAAVLFFAGDFLNLPLWPVDWLTARIPIEIVCRLQDYPEDQARALIQSSDRITVKILDESGEEIQVMESDLSGVIRAVLPEGRFGADARLITIFEGKRYIFSTSPGIKLTFRRGFQKTELPLIQRTSVSMDSLQNLLKIYLKEGDWDDASVVARDLSPETQEDIRQLIQFRTEYSLLSISAYNSAIYILRSMSAILKRYDSGSPDFIFRIGDMEIYVESRLSALIKSRNGVVSSYIQLMREFIDGGRLESALEEWNQLTFNPELYPEVEADRADLPDGLIEIEEIIFEVNEKLPKELQSMYEAYVAMYKSGEILDARQKFTQLLTHLRNLSLHEEYFELASSVRTYLDDISLIAAANEAIRHDKLEYALELFDIVLNPSDLVNRRIEEIRYLMKMRSQHNLKGQ